MNRKSLIFCLSLLGVMIVGIGVAVALLYSGSASSGGETGKVADGSRHHLLHAVPSDAVAVFSLSEADLEGYGIFFKEALEKAADSKAVISFHHAGKRLVPLYVVDAGKIDETLDEQAVSLVETVSGKGWYVEKVDCAGLPVGRYLSDRTVIVFSESENLVKSSVRHLENGESVLEASGFAEALSSDISGDALFISNVYSQRVMSSLMTSRFIRMAPFFSRFADWTVLSLGKDYSLSGTAVYERGTSDFMNVLEAFDPAVSSLSSVVPSYTIFAVSLPVKEVDAYISAYEGFVDSRQKLADYQAEQKSLVKSTGMKIEDFLAVSEIREVAKASFKVAGKMESVNLVRVDKDALTVLCPEAADGGVVAPYKYSGYLGSIFGDFFNLEDESFCVCADGDWIISGSHAAVDEYVTGNALEYTLEDKMNDAGKDDLLASSPCTSVAYFSFSEDKDGLRDILSPGFRQIVDSLTEGCDFCPLVFMTSKDKNGPEVTLELVRTTSKRTKAPVVERDTTVVIPEGPFEVKNSGTGKMNRFYQNSHLSLCLSEEGKDLWGIPFKDKICGYAQTIDYYANGKLQILFGAGSKLYLIDRLGRFVNGFPVDLGKEILLGPQPYDFNGTHRYNVMVLHKDNRIEMYNLKGVKPDSWKGITVEETIKALPERIEVGGKSYWVVRTSIQTLIFPFVGGTPLTVFEGDKKIRPDSPVNVIDVSTVEVECYDGHKRTIKLNN